MISSCDCAIGSSLTRKWLRESNVLCDHVTVMAVMHSFATHFGVSQAARSLSRSAAGSCAPRLALRSTGEMPNDRVAFRTGLVAMTTMLAVSWRSE